MRTAAHVQDTANWPANQRELMKPEALFVWTCCRSVYDMTVYPEGRARGLLIPELTFSQVSHVR